MDESMSSSRWKREGRHHSHFRIRYLLAAYYFFVVKGKFRRLVCSVAFIFLLDLNSDSLQQSSLRFFFCLYPPWIDYCYSFSTAWTSGVFIFYRLMFSMYISVKRIAFLVSFFCSIWRKQTWLIITEKENVAIHVFKFVYFDGISFFASITVGS